MKIPLLVIVGPTAVGKTKLAVEVALRLGGEVISADSRQVYRYMDIGTAKPTLAERKGVPHHLLDVVDPDQAFSVADFQRLAREAVAEVWSRKKLPLLVGGTGLYVHALIDNYNFSSAAGDWKFRLDMRALVEQEGGQVLWKRLQQIDPVTAHRLHPNDVRRIIRALEVFAHTGLPLSEWEAGCKGESPYNPYIVGLTTDRKTLYARIEKRVDEMIRQGLVQEVENLLQKGYNPELNAMQGLGYKELIPYLQGRESLEAAVIHLKRNTRRFAKRQLTWFRRDSRIIWYQVDHWREKDLVEDITKISAGKLGLAANRL